MLLSPAAGQDSGDAMSKQKLRLKSVPRDKEKRANLRSIQEIEPTRCPH